MSDYLDVSTAAQKLREGKLSIPELVSHSLSQIKRHNPHLNALITVRDEAELLKEAEEKQQNLKPASSKLYGIPYVLKDAYLTSDLATTAASAVLTGYKPPYDAEVYTRLKQSGAILMGKANMDAWGHGGSTENTDFGAAHNPYDLKRVAGGSSGGSAVAIASGMCLFAIGEDTGGSIRNPSAWNNTTGLKVTYGRVSRYGSIAYASSFDTVGPMGKSALDCAIVLETIAGRDSKDATSSHRPVNAYEADLKNNSTFTIGIPKELLSDGLDPEIKTALKKQAEVLKTLGHTVKDISMPLLSYGLGVYYLIAPSETSSNLGRYDGVRYGNGRDKFTPETMRRIMIGTYALSAGYYDAFYRQAQKARTLLIEEYDQAFKNCDVILMPVNPTMPPEIGDLIADPLANMLADMYTVTHNPAGIPSLALPAGFSQDKLPIGTQISGPLFSESSLLNLAHQYQLKTDWHTMKPEVSL